MQQQKLKPSYIFEDLIKKISVPIPRPAFEGAGVGAKKYPHFW